MKKIIVPTISLLLVLLLAVANTNITPVKNYDKVIGSDDGVFFKLELEDIDELLENTDLIVRGSALNNGKFLESSEPVDPEFAQKYEKTFGKEYVERYTYLDFEVDEVLYGNTEEKSTIVIRQYGEPGIDLGETKLKPKKDMLLLLQEKEDGVYWIVGLESGQFSIDSNDKLLSGSYDSAVAQYDNKQLKDLLKAISKSKKIDKNKLK